MKWLSWLPLPTLGQAVVVALVAGAFAGGWGAWRIRGVEVGYLELELERLKGSMALARSLAEARVNDAQRQVDDRTEALTRLQLDIKELHDDYARRLAEAASRTHPAVGPAAGRLLRDASRAPRPTPRQDPRPPAPAPAATDPVPGAGWVSEAAVTDWGNRMLEQYKGAREIHRELAGIVIALPCTEVARD